MADETPAAPAPDVQSAALQQQIILHAQYVRDCSFENPRVPHSLKSGQEALKVDVGFNIATRPTEKAQDEQMYEVVLKLAATAKRQNDIVYVAEVEYGGIATLPGAPGNIVNALLQVEVPRLLFPFARQQIFEMVQDGGHPPLLLPPIDFVAFFQQQLRAAQEQKATEQKATEPAAGEQTAGEQAATA